MKPIPQNDPRVCPNCGFVGLKKLAGVCKKCDATLHDDGSWVIGDPFNTRYTWYGGGWQLVTRGESHDAYYRRVRREAGFAEEAAMAEARRVDRVRGPRPTPRLIRMASEAEELCAEWIRWMGFPDAQVTAAGADGGIDVIGTGAHGRLAAQVKFEAVKAGRPKLQELYGAAVAERATMFAFFSSAGYTQQALVWADQVDMALFGFELDGSILPINMSAQEMFTAS